MVTRRVMEAVAIVAPFVAAAAGAAPVDGDTAVASVAGAIDLDLSDWVEGAMIGRVSWFAGEWSGCLLTELGFVRVQLRLFTRFSLSAK